MTQPQQQQQTRLPEAAHKLQQQYPRAKMLTPGEILREGDIYYSTSGKWEVIPCPGAEIRDNGVQFARIDV